MEKNAAIVQERALTLQNHLKGFGDRLEVQDFLLFLTDLETLKIHASNLKGRTYLGKGNGTESIAAAISIKDLVHPEDAENFQEHLETCKNLSPEKEAEVRIRIKNKAGDWQDVLLRHRLYQGTMKNCLLGIGKEIGEYENSLQEVSSKNRNTYKILLNSLDEGFSILELIFDLAARPIDYLILETNPAFKKQSGLLKAEGKTIVEMVPEREEFWFKMFGKVAISGEPKRFQQFTRANHPTWYNLYAFPVGAVDHPQVAVLFSNITDTKVAEDKLKKVNELLEEKVAQRTQELRENSELLQSVFDTSKEAIVVYEPVFEGEELVDFEYRRVNKVVSEQYERKVMVGQRFLELNPHAVELGIFEVLKTTMLTGTPKEFEILYDRDGYNDWFQITTRRQKGLLITTVEDITKKKKESQRLKDTIRFKKHLTRTSPDIIMIFNLYDECIRYINRDMAPLKGMKKRDILGKQLLEIVPFIHPRDREKALDFHNRILQARDSDILEMEFRLRTAKGKYLWYNALGKIFMRNKNANVYEYMLLLRNVDEQKATQKALLNAEKLSIKGEIARTLAHELRNPLASIGMASDLLERDISGKKDSQKGNYLNIIKRSTNILNNLVTDLLTSSNYSPVVLEKNCLAAILEDSLRMAEDRIYLSGIRVKKQYQGPYYIHADEEKLKIALLNIVVNASEAMEPDEGLLQLSITEVDKDFTLTVEDNGCGLEKEQLEKLFDAFYTQRPNGIGVGLNSVKTILEEHDARIEVKSEPNKGTVFRLSFHCYENFERS